MKVNKIITLAVVVMAGLWFMLVVLLPRSAQGEWGATSEGWQRVAGEGWQQGVAHPLGQLGAE